MNFNLWIVDIHAWLHMFGYANYFFRYWSVGYYDLMVFGCVLICQNDEFEMV